MKVENKDNFNQLCDIISNTKDTMEALIDKITDLEMDLYSDDEGRLNSTGTRKVISFIHTLKAITQNVSSDMTWASLNSEQIAELLPDYEQYKTRFVGK